MTSQTASASATPVCLNIAHRGARAYAPENTLAAFVKAREFGCDMVELDIRMSRDGVIVVHHDESLQRCTNIAEHLQEQAEAKVWDLNLAELQELDAGSWFLRELELLPEQRQSFLQSLTDEESAAFITAEDKKLYGSGKVAIPTLAETLALCKHLGLLVNIELKSPCQDPQSLINGTLDAIVSTQMTNNVLISSFDHDYLRLFYAQSKTIPIAALTDTLMRAPVTYLRRLKASACNMGCFWDFPKQSFVSKSGKKYLAGIAQLKKAGIPVNVWTCNNTEEIRHLIAAGIGGVISDYPNRVKLAMETLADKS